MLYVRFDSKNVRLLCTACTNRCTTPLKSVQYTFKHSRAWIYASTCQLDDNGKALITASTTAHTYTYTGMCRRTAPKQAKLIANKQPNNNNSNNNNNNIHTYINNNRNLTKLQTTRLHNEVRALVVAAAAAPAPAVALLACTTTMLASYRQRMRHCGANLSALSQTMFVARHSGVWEIPAHIHK